MAQCSSCDKTGLYRVGNRVFCKTHLGDGQVQLRKSQLKIDFRAGGFEEQTRKFDKLMRQADNLRSQHAAATRPKGRN